jgi:hypothetical protein
VKILGLWYHHPVLDEPRFQQPSARGGKHTRQWVIRSDRRDRRTMSIMRPGTSCAGGGCRPRARSPRSQTRPLAPFWHM